MLAMVELGELKPGVEYYSDYDIAIILAQDP